VKASECHPLAESEAEVDVVVRAALDGAVRGVSIAAGVGVVAAGRGDLEELSH
jgi:hypothetical protein